MDNQEEMYSFNTMTDTKTESYEKLQQQGRFIFNNTFDAQNATILVLYEGTKILQDFYNHNTITDYNNPLSNSFDF